jgi:hypothetical protein
MTKWVQTPTSHNKENQMNFKDVLDLLNNEELDLIELVRNPDFWSYGQELDTAGKNVLSQKSDEYIMGMISVIKSMAGTCLTQQGISMNDALYIASDQTLNMYATLLIKMTVGFCTVEEIR